MKTNTTTSNGLRAAFTILELLTSMTVLLLILGILGAVLGASGDLWRAGTDRNRLLAGARAAFDLITADLEQAVANSNRLFTLTPDETEPFGFTCNALRFYRVVTAPGSGQRATEQVWIGLEPVTNRLGAAQPGQFQLARKTRIFRPWEPWPETPDEAASRIDAEPSAPLLESVAGLWFAVPRPDVAVLETLFSDDPDTLVGDYTEEYGHRLPAFVDIYLELLPPATARRAAGLPENRQADFVEENAIRLTRRIALNPIRLP